MSIREGASSKFTRKLSEKSNVNSGFSRSKSSKKTQSDRASAKKRGPHSSKSAGRSAHTALRQSEDSLNLDLSGFENLSLRGAPLNLSMPDESLEPEANNEGSQFSRCELGSKGSDHLVDRERKFRRKY